jgi:hypothetical protein
VRHALALAILVCAPAAAEAQYDAAARKILDAARADGGAWEKLSHLTDRIGARLAGSPEFDRAAAWAMQAMKADGHENVRAEPVTVGYWRRVSERAAIVAPVKAPIALLALGDSPSTPKGGLTAPVLVVASFDELAARAGEVKGKIVLFNHVMPPYGPEGSGYGEAARYRGRGPARAAKLGAVAAMVRTLTARSLRTPHTGNTSYRGGDRRIPAVAISTEDADYLARLVRAGETRVHLEVATRNDPSAPSANVIGELVGREKPDEIVLIGAHLDSWDVGQGAHDDGAGCAMAMQALTLLRKLDLRPRRTVRVVLFTDEESGLMGARTYGKTHAAELDEHVAAIETDSGGFRPLGFDVETGEAAQAAAVAMAQRVAPLLAPVGAGRIEKGHGGADIGVLGREGVPLLGLDVEGSRYFDYHHSQADTLDKVDRDDLALGAGVVAVMAYVLAEQPETLPRAPTPPPRRPE